MCPRAYVVKKNLQSYKEQRYRLLRVKILLKAQQANQVRTKKRFFFLGKSLSVEVVACLMKAKRRKYIDEKMYFELYEDCEKLVVALQTFINKLK